MIVKGRVRGDGAQLGVYLQTSGKNERIDVLQVRGAMAQDVRGAIAEMEAWAEGTKCENPFVHAQLSPAPGERLTAEQWERSVDILAEKYGMEDHARVIVLHTKKGEQHAHVVFARIDQETMTAWHDGWMYPKHEAAARQIEREFGLQRVQGVFVEREADSQRPDRTPDQWEMQQGERLGIDPRRFNESIRELRSQCDSGRSFAAALAECGVTLCQGDRRGFVLVDDAGGVHALSRVLGTKEGGVRELMADIDREGLPTVAEARAHLSRAPSPEIERSPEPSAAEIPEPTRAGPEIGEAREVWQHAPEPTREEELRQRREIAAETIGQAWHDAARDPVQFVIELGQRGLTLAEDDKGRFVAVDSHGFGHFLTDRALGESAWAVQELLGQGFAAEGVSVPIVAEVREGLKAERKAAWIEERNAERRAAYIEKQRERYADNDLVQGMIADYLHHPDNAAFADALAERNLVLGRVSDDEATRMAESRAQAKEIRADYIPAAYEAGTLFAVAHDGRSYILDATTLYDSDDVIAERFMGFDPGMTWTAAKDAQREARRIERQEARYERLADNRTLGQTLAAIGDAYNESLERGDFGAAFVAELEKRDLLYVVVSAEEAERSKERHEVAASWGRYEPSYEEGQALVLDKSGRAYTLDRATIYDDPASIAANLATITNEGQFSLDQGRDVMAWWREQEREEPRSYARDGEPGGGNPEILLKQAGRLMEYAFHALGDVLEYFAGGMAPTARHTVTLEIGDAPQPERNPARDGRDALRRTSWENAATDPQTQSLTQSHNADADMIAEIQRQIDEADRRRRNERER